MFKVTKYGLKIIVIATFLAIIWCVAPLVFLRELLPWWALALIIAPDALLYFWVLWFFRDPERDTPQDQGLFISPADGRIADITNIGPDSELGRDGVRVGIFMNVFNVHLSRSPIDAVVESVEHRPGLFLDVRDPHASERNESTTIRLKYQHQGQEYPVVVRQIAGLVARRIVTDLTEGQTITRGQRIGMIRFGSRLELLAPVELISKICVEIGQISRGAETVLIESIQGESK
ncbi:MAG: phosphatidylserine decarboxylase family protein [Phycisphaerales bacterium]|jgi:phosphatidylserine decarboxylase|nr:phosphatidylserine decarboxylase family protein [Phycisphaerales bacterium]